MMALKMGFTLAGDDYYDDTPIDALIYRVIAQPRADERR